MSAPGTLRRAALAACFAAAGGCVPSPVPEPPQPIGPIEDWHPLAGCYRADDWHFALDTVPALAYWNSPPAGALQAWSYGESDRGDLYWVLTPEGDARLVEHNGMDGSTARFRATGDCPTWCSIRPAAAPA